MKIYMKQERIKRGWTQEQIAHYIGITAEAVSMLESGQRKPSYEVLVKLEDLFGKTHRELFAEAEEPNG